MCFKFGQQNFFWFIWKCIFPSAEWNVLQTSIFQTSGPALVLELKYSVRTKPHVLNCTLHCIANNVLEDSEPTDNLEKREASKII